MVCTADWETHRRLSPPDRLEMNAAELLQRHADLLEAAFPPGFFSRRKVQGHPAYVRWKKCRDLAAAGGRVDFPHNKEDLATIGRLFLDAQIFISLADGNRAELFIDSVRTGHQRVDTKIFKMMEDPTKFEDLMVELSFAAWHLVVNNAVTLMEEDGQPDMRIDIPSVSKPVYAECKHLSSGTSNNIKNVLRTANRQIRNVDKERCEYYGVAVLDVTNVVLDATNVVSRRLQGLLSVVEGALNGAKNRSIGAAIVVWDNYSQTGVPPQPVRMGIHRSRKIIRHSADHARCPISDDIRLFDGYSLTWRINDLQRADSVFTKTYMGH